MANISSLNLLPVEPLDMESYSDQKAGFELPKAGRYTVRIDAFPETAFGATKAGNLSVQVDPIIVAPSNENFVLRFTKLSAKTWKRGESTASQIGDYLRAFGRRANVSGDPQDLADAVEQTAGMTCEADIDWRAYNGRTGFVLEGMKNFPKDAKTGEPQSWVEDPQEKDPETGEPTRLRANAYVRRFICRD